MRTSRGPAILPPIEIHPDELLSNWRKLVCASGLTALPREVAAGSVVLELTDDHVLLRPRSRMLLTPDVVHLIEGAMKRLKGESFQVKFDAQEQVASDVVALGGVRATRRATGDDRSL